MTNSTNCEESKPPLNKPHLKLSDQLEKLRSKNLCCKSEDDNYYINLLKHVGYYRFSGYAYPFRNPTNDDLYKRNTYIDDIYDLYQFDKRLRSITLKAIALIEISIRANVILAIGSKTPNSPHNYFKDTLFTEEFKSCSPDQKLSSLDYLKKAIDKKIEKSKKNCILDFKDNHNIEELPIWISAEIWSFGDLCIYIEGLIAKNCKSITNSYGIREVNFFKANLNPLKEVRNICAHHDRLWNIVLTKSSLMIAPNENHPIPSLDHVFENRSNDAKLYSVLSYIRFLLLRIDKSNNFHNELKEVLESFPSIAGVSIKAMGFPENWLDQKIWK